MFTEVYLNAPVFLHPGLMHGGDLTNTRKHRNSLSSGGGKGQDGEGVFYLEHGLKMLERYPVKKPNNLLEMQVWNLEVNLGVKTKILELFLEL